MRRAVQEPRRHADDRSRRGRRCRPTRCASSAIRSPSWSPRPCCRRRTPPKRSRSTSRRCRPWCGSKRRCSAGAPLIHDEAPGNVALDYHYGDSEQVAAAFAKAAHVTQPQAHQQPRGGQRDGAARRDRRPRPGKRALHAARAARRACSACRATWRRSSRSSPSRSAS